jgi:hypothetical protein
LKIKTHGSGGECVDDIGKRKEEEELLQGYPNGSICSPPVGLCGLQEHPDIPKKTCQVSFLIKEDN